MEFSTSKEFFCRSAGAGKDQRVGVVPKNPDFFFFFCRKKIFLVFHFFGVFYSVFQWLRWRRMERGILGFLWILGFKYWENWRWKRLGMEAGNWWEEERDPSSLVFPGVPMEIHIPTLISTLILHFSRCFPWNSHSCRISILIPHFSNVVPSPGIHIPTE